MLDKDVSESEKRGTRESVEKDVTTLLESRLPFVKDVLLRPPEGQGFSCLSYNILVPNAEVAKGVNAEGAWWVYKMYREPKHSAWLARKELLKQQLVNAEPSNRFDVICLQEVAPMSFEEDFDFLVEAGYSALLHQSENQWMRPATFWRSDTWERIDDLHLPRTLVTVLRARRCGSVVFTVNVHLVAGVERMHNRFRHIVNALDAVAAKAQELGFEASTAPVVFCGDFNAEGHTAVRELLIAGQVLPDFRDPLDPDKKFTDRGRVNALGTFSDAAEIAFDGKVPATMLASNGYAKMLRDAKGTKGPPTERFMEAIEEVFTLCCSEQRNFMVQEDIDRWLLNVNGALGRGNSYMAMLEKIKGRQDPILEKDDFINIYIELLRKGFLHEVQHDLVSLGGHSLEVPSEGPNQLRFDYMYFTSSSLRLVGVQKALTDDQQRKIWSEPWEVLPNAWHPSDHLPVAACFEFK